MKKQTEEEAVPGLTVFIGGVPQPKGSPSIMRNRSTGRPFMLENEDSRAWADTIRQEARITWGLKSLTPAFEFKIHLVFIFARPPTSRRSRPTVKPDLDKLVRNVLDALTGIVWNDDAQVTELRAAKIYGEMPGVGIELFSLPPELIKRPAKPRGSRRSHDLALEASQ